MGAGFYPVNRDKSPAIVGKLDRATTTDKVKIGIWAKRYAGIAARIFEGSKLLVLDIESPDKHPGYIGPDGMLNLCDILHDHNITLPYGPAVQTPTHGWHLYFRVPPGFRVRSVVSVWGGIDVLAENSSVILPGSHTRDGQYTTFRGFDEYDIPQAPVKLLKLIEKAVGQRKPRAAAATPMPKSDIPPAAEAGVDPRTWFRLHKNKVFRSFWNGHKAKGDTTPSAYEFHLAKACFCNGLTAEQTFNIIMVWRHQQGLKRTRQAVRKLEKSIIPAAWADVEPWVRKWRSQEELKRQAKIAAATSEQILALIAAEGPQTPATVAESLSIPLARAQKAMQRLNKRGRLDRTREGYIFVGDTMRTKNRITTPHSSDAVAGSLKKGRRQSSLTTTVLARHADNPATTVDELASLVGAAKNTIRKILARHAANAMSSASTSGLHS